MDKLSILAVIGGFFLVPIVVFAAVSCGNGTSNTSGGGSTGGGSDSGCCLGVPPTTGGGGTTITGGGGTSTPPPPPPSACSLTISPRVVERAAGNVTVSWSPTDTTSVRLSELVVVNTTWWSYDDYQTIATVDSPSSSYSYNISGLSNGMHTVRASYTRSGTSYVCEEEFSIVDRVTACNDMVDSNDPEDSLIDARDPGCHTDGDPSNPRSYDPNDNDESNPYPDLIASMNLSTDDKAVGYPLTIRGTFRNTERVAISRTSEIALVWRRVGASCSSWSCVTVNGNSYSRATYSNVSYGAQGMSSSTRQLTTNITPSTVGTYEVCAVADRRNDVQESEETDNVECVTFNAAVLPPVVNLDIKKVGVPGWAADNLTVLPGEQVVLRSRPLYANSCQSVVDSTGQNGFTIPWPTNETHSGISVTEPALGLRTYTLQCTNSAGTRSDSATVNVSNIATPLTISSDPGTVRRNGTPNLVWNLGGRTQCTVTGNGENFTVNSDGSQVTNPIVGETSYTITCADDGATAETIIDILPGYEEF